jgi:hypothetical protein
MARPKPFDDYCLNDADFAKWLRECDELLEKKDVGGVFEHQDWEWRNCYDRGVKPAGAVVEFMGAIGYKKP